MMYTSGNESDMAKSSKKKGKCGVENDGTSLTYRRGQLAMDEESSHHNSRYFGDSDIDSSSRSKRSSRWLMSKCDNKIDRLQKKKRNVISNLSHQEQHPCHCKSEPSYLERVNAKSYTDFDISSNIAGSTSSTSDTVSQFHENNFSIGKRNESRITTCYFPTCDGCVNPNAETTASFTKGEKSSFKPAKSLLLRNVMGRRRNERDKGKRSNLCINNVIKCTEKRSGCVIMVGSFKSTKIVLNCLLLVFMSVFSSSLLKIPLASCQTYSSESTDFNSSEYASLSPEIGSNFGDVSVTNPHPTQWSGESSGIEVTQSDSSHLPLTTNRVSNGIKARITTNSNNYNGDVNTVTKSKDNHYDNDNGKWEWNWGSFHSGNGMPPTPALTSSQQQSKTGLLSQKRTKNGKMSTTSSFAGGSFVLAHHSTGFSPLVETADSTSSVALTIGALTNTEKNNKLVKLAPQLAEEYSQRLLKIGPCHCWNSTDDGQKREVECKCTGDDMTNVTGSLPSDIHRLTIENAVNFTTVTSQDLKPYGSSLNELVLSELQYFQLIKEGAFLGMRKLSTIYIHGAPALTQIPDAVFNVYLPELKIIRITHSSLEIIPNLSNLKIRKDGVLYMVELENNKISQLRPGSFHGIVAEHLALSYNDLEEIGPIAFNGSTIARLDLKGNPLKILHPNSFVGIDSLRVLDLSETQITYLPTQGLTALEVLRLEKVWTLSAIPSIYHFQELKEAWLTWPYHCCAFAFPETHDPAAFQRYKEYVRSVLNELCAQASANNASTTELPVNNNDNNGIRGGIASTGASGFSPLSELNILQRQKRHLFRQRQQQNGNTFSFRNNEIGNDPHYRTKRDSIGSNNVYINNVISSNKDKKYVWEEAAVNEAIMAGSSNPHDNILSFNRMRKRSANGHHPRQQKYKEKSGGVDEKLGSERNENVFHHPHVAKHHSGAGGSSNNGNWEMGDEGENPLNHQHQQQQKHSLGNDDGFDIHYEKMGHEDTFDPFIFNPDMSFAPGVLDPNELEHESDIIGKAPWGRFGQAGGEDGFSGGFSGEGGFDDELGVFHPSVTPSPTVITLCGNVAVKKPPKISCQPLPDAFNPCEDIMGSIWLRGAVWVVVALALFGNTAVLVVLLLAPGRISVQRFLMANLSWADLCMGIYLLMVATQDLVSLGSYFNYAIDWQLGWGCQIAGFLTVFASELSVFTLAVITGERWYALTRAIHLTKRLTLLGASQLMALGWFMAILLAALPLMGVSSYSKTSICLPMGAESGGAVVYLIFLLLFNGLAFLLVACAYWQMYRAVAGHGRAGGSGAAPAASSADTAIAKKMALLVFTDFACWAPVAFFGLTAVGGMPLIGVTDSKILLVFFYPLNACCNPYLYAILTKQYRRDLLLLLSRHGMCTKRAARYKTGAASTNNTMQTMQTVLRMGSMTETKVAGNSGTGRGSLLNGRLSIATTALAEQTLLEEEEEGRNKSGGGKIIPSGASPAAVSRSDTSQIQEIIMHKNNLLEQEQQQQKPQNKMNNKILDHSTQMGKRTSSDEFRKALNLKPNNNSRKAVVDNDEEDDDEDAFDLNGLSGRHIAETTFISIPLSAAKNDNGKNKVGESGGIFKNGDQAKEKLIQQKVEHHHHQNNHHSNNYKIPEGAVASPTSAREKKLLTNDHISKPTANSHCLILSAKEEQDDQEISETTPFCSVRN